MSASHIDVEQAHRDVQETDALLVCAYDNEKKFNDNHLKGAISLDEFQSIEDSIDEDREIIFYCA